jgi:high affinity sulfate transporter 1
MSRAPPATERTPPSGTGPRGYPREWLRADLVAGLTASAVVIPKAMAYATIAGAPLQVGLYTALVPMVIYAVLGTSRVLSVSTTTPIAILSAAALAAAVPGGDPTQLVLAAATLACLVGVMLLLAALLRLGFIADFISEPVLVGFKSGIALVITIDQLPKLFGIHIDKQGFFRDAWAIVQHLPDTNVPTLLLAVLLFVLIFGIERFVPKLPAPLLAVAIAIALSSLMNLSASGVETVGAVPSGFPGFTPPKLDLLAELWPAAIGIALMSFTETVAAARAFSEAGEPRPRPNRELVATGIGNLVGGLFGAMPSGGGTTQTAVNRRSGARSQVAELWTAAMTLATLLLLAPLMSLMPKAALAAVVLAYSVDLVKPKEFREIRRVRHSEFRWAIAAFVGVVLLGTLKGILVAVIVSLASLVYQAYNLPVYPLSRKRGTSVFRAATAGGADETWPGLLLLRIEGRLFFANAQGVFEQVQAQIDAAAPKVVVLHCRAVIDIEYTALKMLTEAQEKLAHDGVELWLASLNPRTLETVSHSRLGERLGSDGIVANLDQAVQRYLARGA